MKKPTDQNNTELDSNPQNDIDQQKEARRKAVKNILAGSGIAVGAATSGKWVKPAVDAVITPAHAQTSTTSILRGSAAISPKLAADIPSSRSVLDLFMNSANADSVSPSLDGACLTLTLDFGAGTCTMLVEYASYPSVMVSGTLSGTSISGSNGSISFTGTTDGTSAAGSISNGSSNYAFSLADSVTACTPTEPRDTTTTPLTTYMTSTTPGPTTPGPTTPGPTTLPPTTFPPTTPPPPTTFVPTTPPWPTTYFTSTTPWNS